MPSGFDTIDMFRKIKEIIGAKEPVRVREIHVEEVSRIIEEYERALEAELLEKFSAPRQEFLVLRSHLQSCLARLGGTQAKTAFHPKIERITKNSLPEFEKALSSALERTFPNEPDAFYQAATESLKGCVKGLAGPGRYLGTVFPEEMKEIRTLVDALGQKINSMTPALADTRARRERIAQARSIYSSLTEAKKSLERTKKELSALTESQKDLGRRREELERVSNECHATISADTDLSRTEADAERTSRKIGDLERESLVVLSTLSHVLKKAEKIVQKKVGTGKELNHVVRLLASEGARLQASTADRIAKVLPVIQGLISSGDIQLKNQEEQVLFRSPGSIPSRLYSLIEQRQELERMLGAEQEMITHHPARVRLAWAEKALTEVCADAKKVQRDIDEKQEKAKVLERDLPRRLRDLEAALSHLLAEKISIVT